MVRLKLSPHLRTLRSHNSGYTTPLTLVCHEERCVSLSVEKAVNELSGAYEEMNTSIDEQGQLC